MGEEDDGSNACLFPFRAAAIGETAGAPAAAVDADVEGERVAAGAAALEATVVGILIGGMG